MARRPDGRIVIERATVERRVARRVLERVRDGAYADRAFAGEARREALDGVTRRQANRLAYGVVQRERTLDTVIDAHLTNPTRIEPAVRDVLRIGAYELCFSDGVAGPVVVDQAVRLVREIPGEGRRRDARAGVVNAVLRKVARDGRDRLLRLSDADAAGAAIVHSVPDWIAEALFASLGPDGAGRVLTASNEPAEQAIRWNPLRGTREEFEALLPEGRWQRDPLIDDVYVVQGAFALEDSPIWTEGRGMGQSRASLLPVIALDPRPGERILDLCAAPGAKTTAIGARLANRGTLAAVERNPARAEALRRLADRLGVEVEIIVGDGREVGLDAGFDAVLVDPPCTGLGVLAARPDARWRRAEGDVPELAAIQTGLLKRALSLVREGGRVVYSTCTLLPAENEEVVVASGAEVIDISDGPIGLPSHRLPGTLQTLPGRDGTDGFFVARLAPPAPRGGAR